MKLMRYTLVAALLSTLPCIASDDLRTVRAVGQGLVSLQAAVAEVSVGIEVTGNTPEIANERLAVSQEEVLGALRNNGAVNIETKWFYLNPQYAKNNSLRIVGYTASTTITFTTSTQEAGRLISAALDAGANKNQGINLRPRDDELKEAERRAIQLAAQDAVSKIQNVLDGLSLTLEEVVEIHVDPTQSSYPMYKSMALRAGAAPELQVMDENFQVRKSVEVVAEFSGG